jgi:competence CoiA-like predicted nuclease
VIWQCFEKTIIPGIDEEGQLRKCIRDVYKETAPFELIAHLKPTLQKFILHNFTTQWQDVQARLAMTMMPRDILLLHLDFAKNYSFEIQNEIQSMYYHTFLVTFLCISPTGCF